jgi:hypothetical protein
MAPPTMPAPMIPTFIAFGEPTIGYQHDRRRCFSLVATQSFIHDSQLFCPFIGLIEEHRAYARD